MLDIKQSLWIVALLLGAVFAQHGFADTYTINFTTAGGSGSPAPSGSFTYDASAPLGSQFTDFEVDWDGFSLDLTSSANNPSGNGCGSYNSAAAFAFLNGAVPCTPNGEGPTWNSGTNSPPPITAGLFSFDDFGPISILGTTTFYISADTIPGSSTPQEYAFADGTWNLTDITTPEPSYLILMAIGLLGVAFARRKRRAQGLAVRLPE